MMTNNVSIRRASLLNLNEMVRLHIIAFPEYYLTHLGSRCVLGTYEQYFKSDCLLPIVAVERDTIVGFIAGSLPGGRIDADFWRKNFSAVTFAMIRGLLRCDRVIWGGLMDRVMRIPRAVKKRFGRDTRDDMRKLEEGKNGTGWLVSIAVDPDSRGRGVAKKMLNTFETLERSGGAKRIRLCAYKTNARALSFYEKNGFKIVGEKKLLYTLEKMI